MSDKTLYDRIEEKIGQLSREKYEERAKVIKYSITFSGGAVAFLVTATTKWELSIDPLILKITLLLWGTTIFTGFMVYIFSYREVWYHQRLPKGLRKKIMPIIELILLYIAMFIQAPALFFSVAFTAFGLWKAF